MFRIVGLIAAVAFIATGMAEGAERPQVCDQAACHASTSPDR